MTLGKLISENLWSLIAGGLALLLSYTIGLTNTTNAIQNLQNRTAELERRADKQDVFRSCATRHLDRIESGANGVPQCDLEVR